MVIADIFRFIISEEISGFVRGDVELTAAPGNRGFHEKSGFSAGSLSGHDSGMSLMLEILPAYLPDFRVSRTAAWPGSRLRPFSWNGNLRKKCRKAIFSVCGTFHVGGKIFRPVLKKSGITVY